MSLMNRMGNCKNPNQGNAKKVLCVCSAGLLRSPTAANVLSREPFNFNTRAAGIIPQFALIPVDSVLIEWADEIVCMEPFQYEAIKEKFPEKKVLCLDIEDAFGFMDETLQAQIRDKYTALSQA